MFPDFHRIYVIIFKPLPVEGGVFRSIANGIAYPFINKCIEIATSQCFDFWRKVGSRWHDREL